MPVLTEPPSMGDVLKYEVNPNYTRAVSYTHLDVYKRQAMI